MGYLPRDLLMNQGFVRRGCEKLSQIARELKDAPPLLVGVATPNPSDVGRPLYNSAVLLRDGAVGQAFHKSLLPTYDVFDEDRYFEPLLGHADSGIERGAAGHQHLRRRLERPRFLEAAPLSPGPDRGAGAGGRAGDLVNLSASPFYGGQAGAARGDARPHGAEVRPAGGDRQPGGRQRRPDLRWPQRRRSTRRADCSRAPRASRKTCCWWICWAGTGTIAPDDFTAEAEIWNALVLGVRDYARKTRFRKVLLGLSGGIDSALTAAIAADAMGAENVLGVMMPSRLFEPGQRGRFGGTGAQPGHPDDAAADWRTS